MTDNDQQFVAWFRHASPYIHAHHGKTFVISFDGAAVDSANFRHLMHDIALLSNLGIHLVLVHGTRLRIERNLEQGGLAAQQYADGLRITDNTALEHVKSACGQISSEIQALLSMGLSNSPLHAAKIKISSGNFITAKPVGVRHGIDFKYTGEVRRVDNAELQRQLNHGSIVLISPLGYSPSGEIFNLAIEDVATSVAIALKANKWVSLSESTGTLSHSGYLTMQTATQLLAEQSLEADLHRQLKNAIRACENGVERVHFVERQLDGGLLLELFSRDGVGTMLSKDPFENLRQAQIDDVGGIIALIAPLEKAGVLVKRSREKLETEIAYFVVQERDGVIIACAALYPYLDEKMAELACVAVHPRYHGTKRGDALLAFMEQQAQAQQIEHLFVMTTRTAHWFQERGFIAAELEDLPMAKKQLYNYQRQSKIFIKTLSAGL